MNPSDRLHRLAVIQSLRREAELNGDAGRWFNEGIKSICLLSDMNQPLILDSSNGPQFEAGQKYSIQRLGEKP